MPRSVERDMAIKFDNIGFLCQRLFFQSTVFVALFRAKRGAGTSMRSHIGAFSVPFGSNCPFFRADRPRAHSDPKKSRSPMA